MSITLRQLDIMKVEVELMVQDLLEEFYRDLAGDRVPEQEEEVENAPIWS